jgi:hypothetical protein
MRRAEMTCNSRPFAGSLLALSRKILFAARYLQSTAPRLRLFRRLSSATLRRILREQLANGLCRYNLDTDGAAVLAVKVHSQETFQF